MDILSRHFDKWVPEPNSGCWLWLGELSGLNRWSDGYPRIKSEHITRVSRAVYEERHGEGSAVGFHIRHRCDMRCCVNPDHLLRGLRQDNMDDMVRRQRSTYGERNPAGKLTEAGVLAIRASNLPTKSLAYEYRVTTVTINEIRRRATWAHLDPR